MRISGSVESLEVEFEGIGGWIGLDGREEGRMTLFDGIERLGWEGVLDCDDLRWSAS